MPYALFMWWLLLPSKCDVNLLAEKKLVELGIGFVVISKCQQDCLEVIATHLAHGWVEQHA